MNKDEFKQYLEKIHTEIKKDGLLASLRLNNHLTDISTVENERKIQEEECVQYLKEFSDFLLTKNHWKSFTGEILEQLINIAKRFKTQLPDIRISRAIMVHLINLIGLGGCVDVALNVSDLSPHDKELATRINKRNLEKVQGFIDRIMSSSR